MKHSISGIPSRRRPGGGNGFSRSRDAAPSPGYTICYEAKSGQGPSGRLRASKPSPYKSTGMERPKPAPLETHRLVLSVISAAKLRVRPDWRRISCWLRFTAAQATLQTHNYKLGVLTHRQLSKGALYTTTEII